ncbi:hypothetical protein IFU23_05215 [Pantoea agglomerans]|uniref:hypothetical protein n=1 Tax=Pantoea TaxID=53335 RepID=UPI00177EEDC8|nr:hypothetical protein [Pantoea agglomerans]MBD8155778.1 hypothetical protein [Pantoea agglomerans]MBD8157505.1 hypothetical protein [Pantoea agglomerans]
MSTSTKFKRTFILANTQHPDSLTDENFFTRKDALIVSNARKGLELKQAKIPSKKTKQLIRFLEANAKKDLKTA